MVFFELLCVDFTQLTTHVQNYSQCSVGAHYTVDQMSHTHNSQREGTEIERERDRQTDRETHIHTAEFPRQSHTLSEMYKIFPSESNIIRNPGTACIPTDTRDTTRSLISPQLTLVTLLQSCQLCVYICLVIEKCVEYRTLWSDRVRRFEKKFAECDNIFFAKFQSQFDSLY